MFLWIITFCYLSRPVLLLYSWCFTPSILPIFPCIIEHGSHSSSPYTRSENKIVNTFWNSYYLHELLTALFLPSFYSPTAPNAIYSHSKCYLFSLQMLSTLTNFYVTIYELLNIFLSGSHSKQLTQIIHYTTEPLLIDTFKAPRSSSFILTSLLCKIGLSL